VQSSIAPPHIVLRGFDWRMLSGLCRRSLPLCRNVSVVRRLPSSRKFSTVEPTETDFAKAIQALHIINGPVSGEKLKYEKKHKVSVFDEFECVLIICSF